MTDPCPLTFTFAQDFSTGFVPECGDFEPVMPPSEPFLSAHNQATEPSRLDRLAAVWLMACEPVELLSARYRRFWRGALISLHDHKGTICVTWRDELSRVVFEGAVMGAWERHGELLGAHTLVHEVQR